MPVIIYRDPNWTGPALSLGPGDYRAAQLAPLSRIGSIRVPDGLAVILPNKAAVSRATSAPADFVKSSQISSDLRDATVIDQGGQPFRVVVVSTEVPMADSRSNDPDRRANPWDPPGPLTDPVTASNPSDLIAQYNADPVAFQRAAYEAGYNAARVGEGPALASWQAGFPKGSPQNPVVMPSRGIGAF